MWLAVAECHVGVEAGGKGGEGEERLEGRGWGGGQWGHLPLGSRKPVSEVPAGEGGERAGGGFLSLGLDTWWRAAKGDPGGRRGTRVHQALGLRLRWLVVFRIASRTSEVVALTGGQGEPTGTQSFSPIRGTKVPKAWDKAGSFVSPPGTAWARAQHGSRRWAAISLTEAWPSAQEMEEGTPETQTP